MYIDEAYLQDAFGSAQVAALCPTAPELSTTIELAEAEIESALTMGGYSAAVPSSVYASTAVVPKAIKLATYGAWLELAHLRHAKKLPAEYGALTMWRTAIMKGELEIPGVPKIVERAVGGIVKTETNESITGSKPQIFGREGMEGY